MKRAAAREIAVHISFLAGVNPMEFTELFNTIFEPDYYATLAEDNDIYSEFPDKVQLEYIKRVSSGVFAHLPELNGYIEKYAKNWQVGRISRIAVAIMRTAMFEILYMPEIPIGASANEAVELTKKYEEHDVVAFVNGILGSFIKGEANFD